MNPLEKIINFLKLYFGDKGFEFVSDDGFSDKTFKKLQTIGSVTISFNEELSSRSYTNKSLGDGIILKGTFTNVSVSGGEVIASY